MIEVREQTNGEAVPQTTPQRITTTMILDDLNNGIGRDGIKTKYGLETWEVTQMFQHPTLKGKKAKKIRKLSFEFVDDTETDAFDENAVDPNQTSIPVPEELESFDDDEEDDDENEFSNQY
jgi:uncharacterized protein (DUF433 family)